MTTIAGKLWAEVQGHRTLAEGGPTFARTRSRERDARPCVAGFATLLLLVIVLGGLLAGCAADAVTGVPTAAVAAAVGAIGAPETATSTASATPVEPLPGATATPAPPTETAVPTASSTNSPTATPVATVTPPATATRAPLPRATEIPSPIAPAAAPPRAAITATPTVAPTASATPLPRPTTAIPAPTSPPLAAAGSAATADVGLDPGHHRFDVGAAGGGLREYEVTLDLALRAKRRLEAAGLRVALSRTDHNPVATAKSDDATEQIRLEQEARVRAVGNARVFVSIHLNAFGDPSLGGTETYYNPDAAGGEGRRLATALQSGVLRRLAEVGYVSSNRGAKSDLSAGKPYGHFFSLRGPMPSALVEALFLSNPAEAALVGRDDVREGIARGIADGVLAYLGR